MAGFEVIVRPVVFPNIRPAPPRVLAPQDDPTQGLAVISGGGGNLMDLQNSWNTSLQREKPHKEDKRQCATWRIYQISVGGIPASSSKAAVKAGEAGEINKENYVDVEVLKKIKLNTSQGPIKVIYADMPPADNFELLLDNQTRSNKS